MIGFIKWLLNQYNMYNLEKTLCNNKDDSHFLNLFSLCREYGFTEAQVLYILNLVDASKGGISE